MQGGLSNRSLVRPFYALVPSLAFPFPPLSLHVRTLDKERYKHCYFTGTRCGREFA
jgi:hypothetical protein